VSRRALLLVSLTLGMTGAIGLAIGFSTSPVQAAFSYLTAWAYAVSIALGALIFLMIGHATNARWAIVFRRLTEAVVSSLPLLAILFVPIALSLDHLYPWVDPSPALGHDALVKIAHKAPYLNVTFFVIRAAVFFAVWIAIGELLMRWSARLGGAEATYAPRLRALSAAGLPPVALTLTFGAFDWLMSLTPTWYSTIFGLLYFSGGFVAALALVTVLARGARRVPLVASSIHASHTGALGRLVFAFLCFWAYMEFSQGIIIWIANKPDEVPWYVMRGAGALGDVFALLVVGHFAIPFFALLSRPLKRRPTLLALVGLWLLAMHYVDVYWLVMPILHHALALHWLDLAAPLAVLGFATAFATARTRRPIAADDPRFAIALSYEGS
jgi:hypothetical protein